MASEGTEDDFFARLGRVESLVERLEKQPDPALREGARELVSTVLELHARGLGRLLELAGTAHDVGALAAREPTLAGLLALHGLHPTPLAERIERALAELAPKLARAEARVELLLLEDAVVRVRLHGKASLHDLVADALGAAAPDAKEISVDVSSSPLVPLRLGRERSAELGAKG